MKFISSLSALLHRGSKKGEAVAKIDALFSKWDRNDSPGCAVAVIRDGEIAYVNGYGMADLDREVPISSRSLFYLGSVSKQFTGMSIALLAQQGALSLDDHVTKYVPKLGALYESISIRHLLHHISGIKDYLELLVLAGANLSFPHTEKEIVALLSEQKALNFEPGEHFLYTNSGYFLLSLIVKEVTGTPLSDFAETSIFQPLGMNQTYFYNNRVKTGKHSVVAYAGMPRRGFRVCMSHPGRIGDGGLLSTLEDLFLWDQNFYHYKVGGKELVSQLLTPGKLNNGEVINYGYGLYVTDFGEGKVVSHRGRLLGFGAEMIRLPEQKFSVICLTNLANIDASTMAEDIVRIYFPDFPKRVKSKLRRLPSKPNSAGTLIDYEGTYYNEELQTTYHLKLKKRNLMAIIRPELLLPLYQTSIDTFVFDQPLMPGQIRFERDANKVVGFSMDTERCRDLHFVRLSDD